MKHKLVSVIMPVYNGEKFIKEAMDSVMVQTYSNWELIVVDDGSTDNTKRIVETFNDPRINYIFQENRGLAAARNTGIHNARSDLIGLLDADDLWLPKYLEKMLTLVFEDQGAALYYCAAQGINEDGKKLPQIFGYLANQPNNRLERFPRDNFIIPSTVMMNYASIKSGEYFDSVLRRLEDTELWIRLLKQGHYFCGVPDVLVNYRIHGESLSRNARSMRNSAMKIVVKNYGIDDGKPESWTIQKQHAYGDLYRYYLLSLVRQENNWQEGVHYLGRALEMHPTLAGDLEIFYQLALGAQPEGYRGSPEKLNLEDNVVMLMNLLVAVFHAAPAKVQSLKNQALGTACYAISLCAYNTHHFPLSRRYFWLALKYRFELLFSSKLLSNWLKSWFGNRLLAKFRLLKLSLAKAIRSLIF